VIDSNNILLLTDYEDIAKNMLEKLVLLRENDRITVCSCNNAKKIIENSLYYIIIYHVDEDKNLALKMIKQLKEKAQNSEIILLLNDIDRNFILSAYDEGIYDYISVNSEPYEILIKIINCFKLRIQKALNSRNEKFLLQQGIIDAKTGMYCYKYLKDIFIDISDNPRIQNGYFVLLTLDEKNKTKISTNRLAQAVIHEIRRDDIAAAVRGGKFCMILSNIEKGGVEALITKLQNKMGKDFKLHAGISKIGIQSFETLDKLTKDALEAAVQNDKTVFDFDNSNDDNSWLEDDNTVKKDFKLFQTAFKNKLNNVITPVFFRFQKECETKLANTKVSQYTNEIESVFSLKNENVHSELTLRYNGHAKFNIELTHSGLDSPENYKTDIPIKGMTEKYLHGLLKRLKTEYKQAAYQKGD